MIAPDSPSGLDLLIIDILRTQGDSIAVAHRESMTVIAAEMARNNAAIEAIHKAQKQTVTLLIGLVGAVALVALVMIAGQTRDTFVSANTSGIEAGVGRGATNREAPERAKALPTDDDGTSDADSGPSRLGLLMPY